MQLVLTESYYKFLVIPILNTIIHRLLRLRNFAPVYKNLRIRYVFAIDEEDGLDRYLSPPNNFDVFYGSPQNTRFDYCCSEEDFDGLSTNLGYTSCSPVTDITPSMTMDYRKALRMVTDFEIGDQRLSATYNGYSILCQFLRIRFPCAYDLQQCICGEKISNCGCYEFYFGRIQYIDCECTFGRIDEAYCTCDDVPAILHDLDEIRRYQEQVVCQCLTDIFHWPLSFLLMTLMQYCDVHSTMSLCIHDFSICVPIWALGDYKPP